MAKTLIWILKNAILAKWSLWNFSQKPQNSLFESVAILCLLLTWCTESLLYLSNMDQYKLNLIVVRGILDAYAHYCRGFTTWVDGNCAFGCLTSDNGGDTVMNSDAIHDQTHVTHFTSKEIKLWPGFYLPKIYCSFVESMWRQKVFKMFSCDAV